MTREGQLGSLWRMLASPEATRRLEDPWVRLEAPCGARGSLPAPGTTPSRDRLP